MPFDKLVLFDELPIINEEPDDDILLDPSKLLPLEETFEFPFINLPVKSITGSENALDKFKCSSRDDVPFGKRVESGEPDPPIDHFSYILVIDSVNDAPVENERDEPVPTMRVRKKRREKEREKG